jgi:hypothetical protein
MTVAIRAGGQTVAFQVPVSNTRPSDPRAMSLGATFMW